MTPETTQNWYSVEITVEPAASEAVEFAFNELGALGTEINNLRKKPVDPVTVIGYFNDLPTDTELSQNLETAFQIHSIPSDAIKSVRFRDIEQTDWLAEWKKHWRPTVIGDFVISPPWETVDDDSKIVIKIEPNMAFGTGTHETTQLCLKALGELYRPEQSFLDVGTGTGILAIAAAKMHLPQGDEYALNPLICGYEIDPDSVRIAVENADANGVGDKIEFVEGSISADTPAFDFVCANLTLDVIRPILGTLIEKANEWLVLSGILVEQQDEIVNVLSMLGIKPFKIEQSGEWIAIIIEMPLMTIS